MRLPRPQKPSSRAARAEAEYHADRKCQGKQPAQNSRQPRAIADDQPYPEANFAKRRDPANGWNPTRREPRIELRCVSQEVVEIAPRNVRRPWRPPQPEPISNGREKTDAESDPEIHRDKTHITGALIIRRHTHFLPPFDSTDWEFVTMPRSLRMKARRINLCWCRDAQRIRVDSKPTGDVPDHLRSAISGIRGTVLVAS